MSGNSGRGNDGGKDGNPPTFTQVIQHTSVAARVPERVARGVFCTGVVLLQGATEFVLDFVQQMNQPYQVVARVVLPVGLVPQIVDALRTNLDEYRKKFGPPPTLPVPHHEPHAAPPLSSLAHSVSTATAPAPPPPAPVSPASPPPAPPKPPSIEEIYDNLKIPDDMLSGVYANGAMLTHTASEFCIDFITTFYPRSAVSARVFLSIPQVSALQNTLTQSWQNFQSKLPQPPKPPAA